MKNNFNIKAKLPAFTIVELMISLIISAIIVSMVYYSFLFFKRQMNRFIHRSNIEESYYMFRKTFNRDLNNANVIKYNSKSIFYMESIMPDSRVTYSFYDSFLVRKTMQNSDTFRIFVRIDKTEPISESVPLIRKIALVSTLDGQLIVSEFFKKYTSVELIDAESAGNEK